MYGYAVCSRSCSECDQSRSGLLLSDDFPPFVTNVVDLPSPPTL